MTGGARGGGGGGGGGAGGGEGWEKGSEVGACRKPASLSVRGGTADGKGAEPFCNRAGEPALKPTGRGGGVGGVGVEARERAGVKADRSMVRDSHSLVTACRSCLLREGWGHSRS